MDVAAALTDAAVAAADSAYAPKVLSSITEDHQDEYLDGTGVDDSALGMLQAMLKAAVNVDDDDYDQLRQEMKGIGVTHEAHMMKSRYDMLKKKLTDRDQVPSTLQAQGCNQGTGQSMPAGCLPGTGSDVHVGSICKSTDRSNEAHGSCQKGD